MKKKIARVLPGSYVIPRLTASEEITETLLDLASRAYKPKEESPRAKKGDEFEPPPIMVIMAPVRAILAAEFFVAEKVAETAIPVFRAMVSPPASSAKATIERATIRQLVEALHDRLPASDAPVPFQQMRSLFCYGDPEANGNEDVPDEELERWHRREDRWDGQLAPTAVKSVLSQWIALMNDLHERVGNGAPKKNAERTFVGMLAYYWTSELNAKPGNSRNAEYDDVHKQKGLFADFVRAAAWIIPTEYRPQSFEVAIREITSKK